MGQTLELFYIECKEEKGKKKTKVLKLDELKSFPNLQKCYYAFITESKYNILEQGQDEDVQATKTWEEDLGIWLTNQQWGERYTHTITASSFWKDYGCFTIHNPLSHHASHIHIFWFCPMLKTFCILCHLNVFNYVSSI